MTDSNTPINQQAEVSDGNVVFDNVFILNSLDYDFTKSGSISLSELNVVGVSTFNSDVSFSGDISLDEITCRNADVTGIATVSGNLFSKSDLYLTGALVDTSGDTGNSGQLLSSTGSGTNWINANSTSVLNAINVGVNLNSSGADHFVSFFGATSGNQPNRVGSQFTYNPATNTMSGINHAGTSTFNAINTTGITTTVNLRVKGQLRDGDGNFGSAGQVLTSDGTDTKWDASSNLPSGSSAQIAITDVSSGTPRLLLATGSGTQKDVLSNSSLTYNTSTQVIAGKISSLSNHNTDDLGEGSSNLYHTTARARSSISASGDLAYNSSTGVMSFSAPSAFVQGMIILWSGNTGNIPTGFVLCDGNNGTPNLTDRFVVGAGAAYSPGATGGNDQQTLSINQIPSHNHSASSSSSVTDSGHVHSTSFDGKKYFPGGGSTSIGFGGAGGYPADVFSMNSQTTGISVNTTTTIGNTGSGSAIDIRPRFYALCYIMKT